MSQPVQINGSGNDLAIICPANQFGTFISGLLGKSQVITGEAFGSIEINRSNIESLFHLVEQRVHEQNEASLIQFTIKTEYDNGSAVEVNSMEEFNNYAETKPVRVRSIQMSWVYIIKFSSRENWERQQIDYSIHTGSKRRNHSTHKISKDIEELYSHSESYGRFTNGLGRLSFRVSYTVRSWGSDIENMLDHHSRGLIADKRPRIRRLLGKYHFTLSMTMFVCLETFIIGFGLRIFNYVLKSNFFGITEALRDNNPVHLTPDQKLSFIVDYLIGSKPLALNIMSIFYIVFFSVVCGVIAAAIPQNIDDAIPSFITITKEDEIYKTDALKRYSDDWMSFVVAFAFSILSGVLGNIIFYYLW